MKRASIFLTVLGLVFSGSVVCYAITFTDTIDFSGTGTFNGRDYMELSGDGDPFIYNYTHNVSFNPTAGGITFAEIILSHHNNSNTSGELWFLYGKSLTFIGQLAGSTGAAWVDQHFTLPSTLYSAIGGGSWSLELSLQEDTSGQDKLWIDKSVLSGNYNAQPGSPDPPVHAPEPGTMLLLASGLIGLAGCIRKKFKK